MAILVEKKFGGAHWYTQSGQPMHEILKAGGDGMKATTLRDARKLHLLPSVTGILDVLDKPALKTWLRKQAALATLRVPPRQEAESEEYWLDRVLAEADKQVVSAADLGSEIHDALEKAIETGEYSHEMAPYVAPVFDWIWDQGITITEREVVVVNAAEGYAGRVDFFGVDKAGNPVIADYKTRKTKPGEKITPYDGQAAQLAAYAAAKFGPDALPRVRAINIYISTTEPGRIHAHEHADIAAEYAAFLACCHIWRHLKGYDPRG